ncbi:MAG: molybdopterin-dependent oxidoreductase [Chthoniobacterales bacterium]|nr:molybdopterin-dependent oxidoreductase [Chthoniobacterales bacterium]
MKPSIAVSAPDHLNLPRGWKAFGLGLLAGAVGALVMTTVMLLLRILFGLPTPMSLIGDRISALIPAEPFLALMGKLGGYNQMKQVGVGSVIAGQLVVGAIGGWVYAVVIGRNAVAPARRGLVTFVLFVVLPLLVLAATLWPIAGTNFRGLPIGLAMATTLVGFGLALFAYERTVVRGYAFLSRPLVRSQEDVEFSPTVGRRAIVLGGIGTVVGLGGAGLLRKLYKEATFSYDGTQYKGKDVTGITPNDKFYTVTKNVVDPKVNPAVWRLEIGGMVAKKRTYTLDEIKAMPAVTQETTLMCISNGIGAGLMSNAVWKGVPLRGLLEASQADPNGEKVLIHGVDNYADTFPLEKAMNPTTLIVYEMNGEPLPDRHGAPARVLVPGYFGEKNVKWVTRIEVAMEDAKGFYEQQGWGPNFIVPIRSRIDVPEDKVQMPLGEAANGVPLKGIAFAGDRGVARVEVSLDDGQNWQEAKIDYPGTELTWVLWSYDWKPDRPGEYQLTVRATDRKGEVQAKDEKRPKTSGETGLHKVTVQLAA